MERYSLIVIADETSPIRRYDVRKDFVRRGIWVVAIAACLILIGSVDYVRVRVDHGAFEAMRVENADQRAQIERFSEALSEVESDLARLRSFERKVRIIANLPGSAAAGGEGVTAVEPSSGGDLAAAAQGEAAVTASGEEAEAGEAPIGSAHPEKPDGAAARETRKAPGQTFDDRVSALRRDVERLGLIAEERETSLADLLDALEDKRERLASTPAIWPARGWLTSRFGNRISPFTGSRQFHAGLDIAAAPGTDVIAPARGRVTFTGQRGALGRSMDIDHGHGIRTTYGHIDEFHVKRGQEIERAQVIATIGNTGRSTGPHLHYVVEVNGKAVDPLDYIFD